MRTFPITRRVATWLPLFAASAGALAQAPKPPAKSDLVTVQEGKLPIVLSAPHGGTKDIPGAAVRKGEGMATGGAGFFSGRDGGTEELAHAISDAIEKRMGQKPYLVAARFHRKYLDANRPPEIGVEDPKAKPTYDAYRDTLAAYCRDVKKQYGRGLLLDVHGQGRMNDTVIRGTQNGKTVGLLVKRYGEKAHSGPQSFFGLLRENGMKVYPEDLKEKDYPTLSGGNIVQTYGSEAYGLDAIQLEFGNEFRTKEKVKDTAEKVAKTVEAFSKLYLTDK